MLLLGSQFQHQNSNKWNQKDKKKKKEDINGKDRNER